MADAEFAPIDVVLGEPVPLANTFGKAEIEAGAAWLVLACVDAGEWRPVTFAEVRKAIVARVAVPGHSWITNPFLLPDVEGLIARGYAERVDDRIGLTRAGLDAIRRAGWVR